MATTNGRARATSTQGPHKRLYDSKAWKDRRRAQLDAFPLCAFCLALGKTRAATVADHVRPHRGDLGEFFHGPLQSLCATCHSGAKQAEENSGTLRGGDTLGSPLDPGHHWNRSKPSPLPGGGGKV